MWFGMIKARLRSVMSSAVSQSRQIILISVKVLSVNVNDDVIKLILR